MKTIKIILFSFILLLAPFIAQAHFPVLEPQDSPVFKNQGMYFGAVNLQDPTKSSLSVYGSLSSPDEYDLYVFTPGEDAVLPIEIVVPIRARNENFKPAFAVMGKDLDNPSDIKLPFDLLEGYKVKEIKTEQRGEKFYEPFSQERYYKGNELKLPVKEGQNYFIAVYDPNKQSGDYALAIGDKEDFSNASYSTLLKNVAAVKLGLLNNLHIPWLDLLGLFLLLTGFIIGLGAVTVIDVHGFLARHSSYWTAATIRSHKITKPLIWLGFSLILIGAMLFYRQSWLNGVVLFQAVMMVILLLNGLFLSFVISPKLLTLEKEGKADEPLPLKLRNIIAVSFMFSFLCWWGNVILLVWYLVMQR